jgi:hypothetical protein
MKRFFTFLTSLLLIAPWCFGGPSPKSAGFLPTSFNGWQKDAAKATVSTDPATADKADASVLKEYGFTDAELATYTRDDRKMEVKAARFNDVSGAYGAFTFFVQPKMQSEKIGDQGASNNTRILFYRGNVLVDVTLDRVTAMSAGDLRALATALPQVSGKDSAPPNLPGNLPKQSYIPHTARYIMGPVAMERLGLPIPPSLVDFNMSAEIAVAKYRTTYGEANLMLISYPTPQIAAEKLRAMEAASLPAGPFYWKRTGPIVVAINGNIPENEAESLRAAVNYDANVTLTQPTKASPRDNIANLIIGIFMLIGVILIFAIIFGFAFGGVRVITKRFFPDKVFDKAEDVEIIRLNLK